MATVTATTDASWVGATLTFVAAQGAVQVATASATMYTTGVFASGVRRWAATIDLSGGNAGDCDLALIDSTGNLAWSETVQIDDAGDILDTRLTATEVAASTAVYGATVSVHTDGTPYVVFYKNGVVVLRSALTSPAISVVPHDNSAGAYASLVANGDSTYISKTSAAIAVLSQATGKRCAISVEATIDGASRLIEPQISYDPLAGPGEAAIRAALGMAEGNLDTQLGSIGSVLVDADPIIPGRTWFADDYRARNIVEVANGFTGTLAMAPALNIGTTIASVSSATVVGPASVTTSSLAVDKSRTRAHFDVTALTTSGSYTVTVTVTTIDSQTIVTTGTLRVV